VLYNHTIIVVFLTAFLQTPDFNCCIAILYIFSD